MRHGPFDLSGKARRADARCGALFWGRKAPARAAGGGQRAGVWRLLPAARTAAQSLWLCGKPARPLRERAGAKLPDAGETACLPRAPGAALGQKERRAGGGKAGEQGQRALEGNALAHRGVHLNGQRDGFGKVVGGVTESFFQGNPQHQKPGED